MSKIKTRNFLQLSWQAMLSDYVTVIAWTPDDTRVAVCSTAGEVVLCQADNGDAITLQPAHDQSMNTLSISHDGHFLASAGQSGTVLIWQINGDFPQIIAKLTYSSQWIDRLQWNPSHPELAFSAGRYVYVWDALSQTLVTTLNFVDSSVLDLLWGLQGEYLAVSGNQSIKIWHRQNWHDDPAILETASASVAIAWSPEGNYLASGNNDRSLLVWEWNNPYPWRMQGFPGKVRQLAWSTPVTPDDPPILASVSADGIVIWRKVADPSMGWSAQVLAQHHDTVTAIAFQPNSHLLASASKDGWIYLWHQANQISQRLQGASNGFSALSWNGEGTALATAGQQGELLVWKQSMRGKGFG
ncbi:MAG: hypothetical protein VKJ02_03200 [Snowella sp.]|nr:hypothetical protein [Snowella sp.]